MPAGCTVQFKRGAKASLPSGGFVSDGEPFFTTDSTHQLYIAYSGVTYLIGGGVSAASKLIGRGSAAGAGDPQEITLGTNLSMSGTTLNATGGGSPGGADTQVQFNDGGSAFGGSSGFTFN